MTNSTDSQRTRLLVIDFDEDSSELVRRAGNELGFEVRTCSDYDTIEAVVSDFIPEIIFLELRLLQHDGVEVLYLLAKTHCKSRIFLVSDMERSIIDSANRVGLQLGLDMAGFVTKPLDLDGVKERLSSELDKRSRFSSDKFHEALGPGEFVINYHPIIVVSADRDSPIVGVEVRPHWKNKRGSKVWLSQIMFHIRENDLVQEFNCLLMDKALESYREWLASDLDLGITVCMDESNLTDPSWPDFMIYVVDKWGVPHDRITIAFEQQAIKNNVDSILSALTRLRISGFKIAIESMGADIEELDELLHIPFSEIRLRRILVDRIGHSMEAEFNVSTLISLAQKREIDSCAVGVRTPEAFTFLQDCGCTTATGSLFGHSLPVTQVENFVRFG